MSKNFCLWLTRTFVFVQCFRNTIFSLGFLARLQNSHVRETVSKQLEELCSHSSGQESEKLKEPEPFCQGNITVVGYSFKSQTICQFLEGN